MAATDTRGESLIYLHSCTVISFGFGIKKHITSQIYWFAWKNKEI